MSKEIHIDTDLGGDIDDLCAVAMALKWPGTRITGLTSVCDDKGKRAGYTKYALTVAQRADIPVKAGADISGGFYKFECGLPKESDYWPEPVASSPNPIEDALDLLKLSIEQGATIVEIGPCTNLFLLDQKYPGILKKAKLYFMGGYIYPVRKGFPQWGNDYDWNIQVDINSAKHVLENADVTLVPLTVTVETYLRRAYLERLNQAGSLGKIIARQAEPFAKENEYEEKIGKTCAELPDDLINFQHDALTVAIALGWNEGVEIKELPLNFEVEDGLLVESVDSSKKPVKVVTKINGEKFSNDWLELLTSQGESITTS